MMPRVTTAKPRSTTSDLAMRGPALLGVGTALPDFRISQVETAERLAKIWGLAGAALERWHRIITGSGIHTRHGVIEPEVVASMTTGERMAAYERLAPPLAEEAARRVLRNANLAPAAITDVVIVSCTGFSAPGVDVALMDRLGLKATTRRTCIGFMGCFGAISGVRVASGLCANDPEAIVLVVCIELCSLHMRRQADVQNQVASALFADGAAAALVAGSRAAGNWQSETGIVALARCGRPSTRILPEGRDWMTWRITDSGFAMTLTRDVPPALRESIAGFVDAANASHAATFIVHPGGPGVLDAVEAALRPEGGAAHDLEASREILRRCGNMSSGTVLFVLEELLCRGGALPAYMLAFGPGLTIEGLMLDACASCPIIRPTPNLQRAESSHPQQASIR